MEWQEYCQECFNTYGQTDECKSCEGRCPKLWPENTGIWELWQKINTQWRVGFGGVVGLDYAAIPYIAEVMDYEITPVDLDKIKVLEIYTLKKQKEECDNRGSQ